MRALILSGLLLTTSLAVAEPIHNQELGFSFTVPDGFVDFPAGHAQAGSGMLYAFARGEPGQPHYEVLAIQDLGGTIGREPLNKAIVEKSAIEHAKGARNDFRFDYRKVKWRDFDLDMVITHAHQGEAEIVAIAVQVPLAKHAIQVLASGLSADEPALQADLARLLASVDGKSNWLSDEERGERLGRLVGMLIGFPLAIWIAVWIKRRRNRAA